MQEQFRVRKTKKWGNWQNGRFEKRIDNIRKCISQRNHFQVKTKQEWTQKQINRMDSAIRKMEDRNEDFFLVKIKESKEKVRKKKEKEDPMHI